MLLSANCQTTWNCKIDLQKRKFSIKSSTFFRLRKIGGLICTQYIMPVLQPSRNFHSQKKCENVKMVLLNVQNAIGSLVILLMVFVHLQTRMTGESSSMKYVFTLKTCFLGTTKMIVISRNTPFVYLQTRMTGKGSLM